MSAYFDPFLFFEQCLNSHHFLDYIWTQSALTYILYTQRTSLKVINFILTELYALGSVQLRTIRMFRFSRYDYIILWYYDVVGGYSRVRRLLLCMTTEMTRGHDVFPPLWPLTVRSSQLRLSAHADHITSNLSSPATLPMFSLPISSNRSWSCKRWIAGGLLIRNVKLDQNIYFPASYIVVTIMGQEEWEVLSSCIILRSL